MRCLLVAAALAAVSARAYAGNPLDKPAFTATPKELLDAAKHATGDEKGSLILRDNETTTFDDHGLVTRRAHFIVAITTSKGIDSWDELWRGWSPWFQERPELRARVISRSGEVHELDPTKLGEEPDPHSSRRFVLGRLTGLEAGAVLEYEALTRDRELPPGGRSTTLGLDNPLPTASTRIVFDAPAAMHLAVREHALPRGLVPAHAVGKGRETWTYTFGAFPGFHAEPLLPSDVMPRPVIGATTASSWDAVAKAYAAAIDPQLKVTYPAGVPKAATRESVVAIVAWVRGNVEFTGAPFDEEAIAPLDLEQVVKRGHGNSNELAALTTALLRQAGIEADIVLVDRAPNRWVLRDVPTLLPFEDALVRARIGSDEIWIDPSERDLPIGALDSLDENCLALDITKHALFVTPTLPTVVHETRTYQLPDLGEANVHEVSREGGDFAGEARRWVRETDPAQLRKDLEGYAKRGYDAKLAAYTTSSPDDFARPFEMTLDIAKIPDVVVHWRNIDITLHANAMTAHLPEALTDPDAPPRAFEMQLTNGHVYEIEHRFTIPDGFAMPDITAETTRSFGALTFRERQRIDGRVLIVEHRLDVPQRRLSVAEVNATRAAIKDLRGTQTHLTCPNTAYALLDEGKVREAFAESRRAIASAPRAALPHARRAQMLLTIGDGDGARVEARKAVELEPKNVSALSALGWVLTFDLAGRQFVPGWDRAGARATLEKAHALDPQHYGVTTDLADVLERDARGVRYETGSDLRAAATLRRAAHELDPDETEQALAQVRDLLWLGDATAAEAAVRTLPSSNARDALLAAATAIAESPDAAIRAAPTNDRKVVLDGAAGTLMMLRHYDAMNALYAATGTASSKGTELTKLRRFDTPFRPSSDPQSVAFELVLEEIDATRPAIATWDAATEKEIRDAAKAATFAHADGMTTAMLSDVAQSLSTTRLEGDANAWRVELELRGKTEVLYLAADHGVPKVIGEPGALAGVGRHVLRLVGKHDDAARRLLDWAVKDARSQRDLAHLWTAGVTRDAQMITLAGILLSGDPDAGIRAGKQCGATTSDGQLVCDYMVARGYRMRKRWDDLLAAADSWEGHVPSYAATYPAAEKATALIHLGRLDEADQLLADVLAKHPTNTGFLGLHAEAAVARHKPDLVIARTDELANARAHDELLLNEAAWMKIVVAVDLPGALALARDAVNSNKKSGPAMNTLAAAEVETGALNDAVHDIHRSIELAHADEPRSADWYVLGRVREQAGERDDAVAAYRRVTKKYDAEIIPTTYDLAGARLKALGASKK